MDDKMKTDLDEGKVVTMNEEEFKEYYASLPEDQKAIMDEVENSCSKTKEEIETTNENHTFSKTHKSMSAEKIAAYAEQKTKEHEEKLKNFEWSNDNEEDSGSTQPVVSEAEVVDCISSVSMYVCNNASLNDYDESNWSLVVKVPSKVNDVLSDRFNKNWSFESRLEQFDKVVELFDTMFTREDIKANLDQKVQELFPSTGNFAATEDGAIGTGTPVGRWEVYRASVDVEDDLIMGSEGDDEEDSDDNEDCVYVTLEMAKST